MFEYVQRLEYIVKNRDQMVAYMERTFGMRPVKLFEKEGVGREAQYRVGQTMLKFKEPAPGSRYAQFLEKHGPGVREVGWGVHNISQVAQQLKARGIPLRDEQGFHRTSHGYNTIHLAQDPLGIDFRLFQLGEECK